MQPSHRRILAILDDGAIHHKSEFLKFMSKDGLRGRLSELRKDGYKIWRVNENGVPEYNASFFKMFSYPKRDSDEDDLGIKIINRKIKGTQDAIQKYYDLLKDARKDIKEIKPRKITLEKNNENLVILNSDWHIGKKIEENGEVIYDTNKAKENLEKFTNNLRSLIGHILNSVDLDAIDIVNIGDLIDGEEIYQGQIENIDEYLDKQIEIGTRQKYKQAEKLQDDFGIPVTEHYVVGNHGKGHSGGEWLSNFDSLIHLNEQIIRDIAGNKELHICENHRLETRLINIRGHKILMKHWAPSQTETSSAFKRYSGWLNIYNYDGMFTAHYHNPKISYFQKKPIIRNGCIFGDDDYSKELGYTSNPSQIVLGISNKRFPTYIYTLDMVE